LKANLPPIDSYNQWPLLSGANTTNPRTEIPIGQYYGGNGNNVLVQGVIVPPYKLLLGNVSESFWQGPLYPNSSTNFAEQEKMVTKCGTKGCLFNIITDPTEHNDVSDQYPNVVSQLQARIKYYQGTVFNADRGAVDPIVCNYADSVYHGFFGPWVEPTFH